MSRHRRSKDRRRRKRRTVYKGGSAAPRDPARVLAPMSADTFQVQAKILKVDRQLGLVFGWAMVSKVAGVDYWDTQDEHIPEDAMLEAATDFMQNSRVTTEMHRDADGGSVVFAFPMTTEIAKAYGIETPQTGLMIAAKPGREALEKFASGEYTGFSIGGVRLVSEEVD